MGIIAKREMFAAEAVLASVLAIVLITAGCKSKKEADMPEVKVAAIDISSPAFEHNGRIPVEYTADGDNVSPAIRWGEVPGGTRSIALICEDPDAPTGTGGRSARQGKPAFVHWVIFNTPADKRGYPRGVPTSGKLSDGSVQGSNDFGKIGYGGPAPPRGPAHRYFFTVYALDTTLDLQPGATCEQLVDAMQGHILAEGELIGKYSR